MVTAPPRPELLGRLAHAVREHQIVVVTGDSGLGQLDTARVVPPPGVSWRSIESDGHWLRGGYLAGFQELVDAALAWCDRHEPELITRYEQSLKRLFPRFESPHFRVPKDLTNTSALEERTRFYHHEYQGKLLVGLAEFLRDYVHAAAAPVLLTIDNASNLSATALGLLGVLQRLPGGAECVRCVLLDYNRRTFIPAAAQIDFQPYTFDELWARVGHEADCPAETAYRVYLSSQGNERIARAILTCLRAGIPIPGYLDPTALVDVYIATLAPETRCALAIDHIAQGCPGEDYIAVRSYETLDAAFIDAEHARRHEATMADYRCGSGPLVVLHAAAIRDKYRRLEALTEPSEVLKEIGLYDTWLSFFAQAFADADLRRHGSGNDATNGVFINAAFVLYALGCGRASAPFLEEFRETFPNSRYIPTALYAESMIYGRYQLPVDLPRAEHYARLNLETIDAQFRGHEKYEYIKVFAENAYAYIKAKQGKFREALQLCMDGNERMVRVYPDGRFLLHRSILIYNTSQVYELVRDYDQAEKQLRLAITLDPYYGEYYNDLGNLLAKIDGRSEDALGAYARAIELCPPYYEAHLNRGVLLTQLGRADEAIADFARALEIKPTEWRAMFQLGTLQLTRGDAEEARRMLEAAVGVERSDADLWSNLGLACSECGDPDTALAHYRMAIRLDPRHATAHNNLAIELLAMGRSDESDQHARVAAELEEAYPP